MPNVATSRVTVVIDSKKLRSKSGASMQMGGEESVSAMTDQGSVYFTENLTPSEVKCTMPHMSDTDLPAIRAFKNGTLHYETNTGSVYTMANARTLNVGPLQNGEVEVTFGGDPMKQTK